MNKKTSTSKLLPWFMWALAACFYCYEFFLQVSPGVMTKELMHVFSVNATAIGTLASLYFYAYASMQLPAGVLLDRFGDRLLLTAAVTVCAIGALIFASTNYFAVACIGRIFIGLGSAFAALGCMHIAAKWLPANRFSLLVGLMLTLGMLGAANGQAPLALLIAKLSWRTTLQLFGLTGLALAGFIGLAVRTKPHSTTRHTHKISFGKAIKRMLRNHQTWSCAGFASLMYTPTLVFGTIWGVPFLTQKYAISTASAATIVSMIFIGWAVGAPIFGWASDYYRRRKVFMFIGNVGAMLTLTYVIFASNIPHFLVCVLLFTTGFFSSCLLLAFSTAREINPPEIVGATIGFMNGMNMLGGAFVPPLVGFILDLTKHSSALYDKSYIYSVSSYETALVILPLAILAAFIVLLRIKETYAQEIES